MRSVLRNWGRWERWGNAASGRGLAGAAGQGRPRPVPVQQAQTGAELQDADPDPEYAPEYDVAPRAERRKPQIAPVCKEIFSSEFDGELLAFPEILNKEELENLDRALAAVRAGGAPWGAPCLPVHGGTSANLTERCRILEEAPLPLALKLRDHWFGLDVFLGCPSATEDLNSLLPDYVSGKKKFRVLVREDLVEDPSVENMQTSVVRSVGDMCYISGTKIAEHDQNPDITDETLIVASAAGQFNFRMVMVQDNSTVQVKNDKIIFEETLCKIINSSKPQGEKEDELNIAKKFGEVLKNPLSNFRLGSAAMSINLIREAIVSTLAQVKGKYMAGKPVVELPLFQNRIMDAIIALYKAESMVYMTCGLADGYESPDIELESALTRITAMNGAVSSIFSLNDIISALHLGEGFSKEYLNAVNLLHRDEIMDMLIVYAGLLGIQHSAVNMSEYVKKTRNPFSYPGYSFRRVFDNFFGKSEEPKLKLRLFENLHQSLQLASGNMETCILLMRDAVLELIIKNGHDTPFAHRDIHRICEVACEIYAMISTISRASRSYCIGLANCEKEIYLSSVISLKSKENARRLIKQVESGSYANFDKTIESVVTANIKNKVPLAEHCLNRVYY